MTDRYRALLEVNVENKASYGRRHDAIDHKSVAVVSYKGSKLVELRRIQVSIALRDLSVENFKQGELVGFSFQIAVLCIHRHDFLLESLRG